MKKRIVLALAFSLLVAHLAFAKESVTQILKIQVANLQSAARITFDLSAVTKPRVFVLSHPDRLVVDFKNTQLSLSLKKVSFSNTLVVGARQGRPEKHVLRLVFDTRVPIRFEQVAHQKSKQVVIELSPKGKGPSLHKNRSPKKLSLESTPQKGLFQKHFFQKIPAIKPLANKHKTMTIVIDPGHGGSDPGAVGLMGITEKEVVLAIALQLADLINQVPGMHAILTRQGDYYISLHNRLVVARKGKADLFIAVHADSYFNNHAAGASVYALSEHGATSIAARWLAKRENYSELNKIDLTELEDQSYLLRSVLIDLAQTATIRDSLRLGNSLLMSLQAVTRLHYARVEQAPFMVLKSPDIPSILVEIGFISNQKEELRLRNKQYQHKMALALFNGIKTYQAHSAV